MSLTTTAQPSFNSRWNESEQSRESCNISQGGSTLGGGDTEHEYDEHDEGLDEISELGTGGVDEASGWSETSPTRSDISLTQKRPLGDHAVECDFGVGSSLPINVGTMSLTSWDAGSEPNLGTDAGTDQDIAAASGLPEEESDDDEDDDEFEVADSLDLGAVALCVSARMIHLCLKAPRHLPRSVGGGGCFLFLARCIRCFGPLWAKRLRCFCESIPD